MRSRRPSSCRFLASDDGSRLWIDDRLVVDHDGVHGPTEKRGSIALAAGAHRLRLRYFEARYGQALRVEWTGPGVERGALDPALLRHEHEPLIGGSTAYNATASGTSNAGSRSAMTTLADVGRRAGVSAQTVSNVVNGRDVVRPATRARVERAIRELRYRPHAMARGLRTARTQILAFVVVDPSPHYLADPFHGAVVSGLAELARDAGYGLLIENVRPGASERQLLEALDRRRLDGAVLTVGGTPDQRRSCVRALTHAEVPIVVLEQEIGTRDVACVLGGNRDGALAATRHLLERGHRRVAYLRPRLSWPAVDERIAGYRQALREARPALEPLVATGADESPAAAFEATRRLLERHPDVSAVFGANDLMAIGALQAAQAAGRAVPRDLAVVGFDDFDFAQYVRPQLTSVRLPGHEMGRPWRCCSRGCAAGRSRGRASGSGRPSSSASRAEFRPLASDATSGPRGSPPGGSRAGRARRAGPRAGSDRRRSADRPDLPAPA